MNSIDDYLKSYWNGHLPVDIVTIARHLNIHVSSSDKISCFAYLNYDEQKNPHIIHSNNEPLMRQRFVVTYALIDHLLKQDKKDYSNQEYGIKECSVGHSLYSDKIHRLVKEFLIPMDVFRYAIFQENITDIIQLSNLFGVSQALISSRIKDM